MSPLQFDGIRILAGVIFRSKRSYSFSGVRSTNRTLNIPALPNMVHESVSMKEKKLVETETGGQKKSSISGISESRS